jgi:hypothetical protein
MNFQRVFRKEIAVRYILADELQCFPPEVVETELERLGITYVQLLERIATVLAQKPALFFGEIAPLLPSYWSVYIQDQYPEDIRDQLLETLKSPDAGGLRMWEELVPYVVKKGTTLTAETIVYERQEWVLALLKNWDTVTEQLLNVDELQGARQGAKRPMLGMVLEAERMLNRVQVLAVAAAQQERKVRGESLPFGEMAVKLGFMSADQLAKALDIQADIAVALDSPKRLGFYLIEAGVITPTQLRVALLDQKETGMPLGQVLVSQGAIDQSLLDTMLQVQRMERITMFAQESAS